MVEQPVCLPTFEALRQYVHETLCAHDQLALAQSPLTQAVVQRGGRPCGLFFQVTGPRLLRNYAVWSLSERRIIFYDSTGARFAVARLQQSPDLASLAA
jgi:hypothetical protein